MYIHLILKYSQSSPTPAHPSIYQEKLRFFEQYFSSRPHLSKSAIFDTKEMVFLQKGTLLKQVQDDRFHPIEDHDAPDEVVEVMDEDVLQDEDEDGDRGP